MVEDVSGIEKKSQDKIKPSDLRPQAHYYELVIAENPKTNKSSHYLYWWNKERKEVTIEEVDIGGIRVEDTPVVKRQAKFPKEARRKITKDINTLREKGLEIKRHHSIDKKIFDESVVKQGMLIPYFKELNKDRDKNVNEAWQYYDAAKEIAGVAKAQEKTGKVLRKSVFGPSEKAKLEKQGNNLRIALDEREKGLRFFNHYLNKRIGVDAPAESYDSQYESYVKYDRKLADIARLAQTDSLEEKDRLLKEYEGIFSKKLEVHHKLAEERGLPPVKEIPEELPIGKKPKEKKEIKKKPKVEEEDLVPTEKAEKKPEIIKAQPEPEEETQEVPVKVKEPEELIEEVKDINEALSASAKGLKDKGSYTFALKGSGAEELVGGIIPRFKEKWEGQGIKILDFSIAADIKLDAGQIEIDVEVKKSIKKMRIQATLKLESKDGVLNTTQVSANPSKIRFLHLSFNVQEMIEENIGGEKIHSIISEWLSSEMDERGAKIEKVEFEFTPQDTLQVNVVGGAK